MRFLFLIFIFHLFFVANVLGQSSKDSLLNAYFNKAKEQILVENYDSCQFYLKKVFALKTTLPDEMAYFYGLTLVKQKNYKKGKEAIEKYLSLTGEAGIYYNESQALLKEIDKYVCRKCNDTGITEISDTCNTCIGTGKISSDCNTCNIKGVEFCNACGGNGVFTNRGNLGTNYTTCTKCRGNGYYKCHVCKGTRKKEIDCNDCKGHGFQKKKVTCTH